MIAEVDPEVGKRIVALRVAVGWDQTELAAKAGITRVTLWRIESGERTGSSEVLRKIATALEVTVSELIGDSAGDDIVVAKRIAGLLTSLNVGEPVGFLRALASLPVEQQASVATIVYGLAGQDGRT